MSGKRGKSMFCEKCGKEVEETWNQCPYCSHPLKDNGNARTVEDTVEIPKFESRADLKKYLTEGAWGSDKRNVVAFYGSYAISGDLFKVLQPGEVPEQFVDGYIKNIFSPLKHLRFFRNYIVCTNQRIIYYETGRKIFKLLPFLRRVKSFAYQDIKDVQAKKRVGLYSGSISLVLENKEYRFVVLSMDYAEKIREIVNAKR